MELTVPAVVRYELVRIFRRRSTFWATLSSALLLFAAVAITGGAIYRQIDIDLKTGSFSSFYVLGSLGALEVFRYILLSVEVVFLSVLAYVFAHRSIVDEVEGRSYALLLQTPAPINNIILGKMLGLAIALLVLHSIFSVVLALPTPFMRRPLSTALFEFLSVWLFAACFLPEGAAGAMAGIDKGKKYILFRLASLARVAILLGLIEIAIPPASRAQGIHVWDVLVSYWQSSFLLTAGEHLGLSTVGPYRMIATILGWQAVSGLLMWLFFVKGRIR